MVEKAAHENASGLSKKIASLNFCFIARVSHYYLSSVICDKANYFAKGIREHWSIENKLHWVKDVQMNEDNSMIYNVNACQVLSILKSLALNIYRINGYKKYKPTVEIFINRLDKLKALFRT